MRGYSTDRRSVRVVGWVRNFAKASQIRSPLFRQVSAPSSCCSGVPKAFPARTAWMVKAGLERLRLGVRSLAWQSFLEVSVQPVLIFDGGLSPIGPFTRRREPMNRSSPSTGSDRKSSLKLLFPRGSLTKSRVTEFHPTAAADPAMRSHLASANSGALTSANPSPCKFDCTGPATSLFTAFFLTLRSL
jgi:hypothetical protein